jgi:hypothetical protein
MWYTIYQQKCPKPEKDPVRREILLDLDDEIHELATKLGIEIVIEIGDTLAAIIGSWGDKEITTMAQVTIPGVILCNSELPTIQEACTSLIRIANEPEGTTPNGSSHLYRWRNRTESGAGRLGSDPPVRRRRRKTSRKMHKGSRGRDNQQPDGNNGNARRAKSPKKTG